MSHALFSWIKEIYLSVVCLLSRQSDIPVLIGVKLVVFHFDTVQVLTYE